MGVVMFIGRIVESYVVNGVGGAGRGMEYEIEGQ
jgi:hypothetical protein